MNPINKALNCIKKYQEPNGPITGYPIFADPETFNQEFLSQRFHTLDSQKDTVKLQKQFERADSTQMMIDPRIPQQDSLRRVYNPNSKPTSGDYTWASLNPYIRLHPNFFDENGYPKPEHADELAKTIVHEKSHALFWLYWRNSPQAKQMEKITGVKNREDYQTMQELRWQYGIDPKIDFTNKDIEYLKQLIKENNDDEDHVKFVDKYTNDQLRDLFNLVADVNQSQNKSDVKSAQQGTKLLIPHKDYLGVPYKQDGDYNYFEAHPENAPSNSDEHWTSRNPITGKLLKSETHPTFGLMVKGEKEADMDIYRGLNGELYSYPKDKFAPLYLKHFNYGKR